MDDVARVAGVHQTTVSRCLRNDPRIRESVRNRVKQVAKELGYRPNAMLSALGAMRRSRASVSYQTPLAYINYERDKSPMQTEHLDGARQAAEKLGYKLEVFTLNDDLHDDRLSNILVARNILGVIIGPLPYAHGKFTLQWEKFASVSISYAFAEPLLDRVVTDSFKAMTFAVHECLNRGYKRLGVLLNTVNDERNENLLSAAYALAREKRSTLANLRAMIIPAWDEARIGRWITRSRPDVIISSNSLLPDISQWLKSRKIRVPDDIGLVNLNAKEWTDYSGISECTPELGASAVKLLVQKLYHNEFGIPKSRVTLVNDCYWYEGKTLRPPASA